MYLGKPNYGVKQTLSEKVYNNLEEFEREHPLPRLRKLINRKFNLTEGNGIKFPLPNKKFFTKKLSIKNYFNYIELKGICERVEELKNFYKETYNNENYGFEKGEGIISVRYSDFTDRVYINKKQYEEIKLVTKQLEEEIMQIDLEIEKEKRFEEKQ